MIFKKKDNYGGLFIELKIPEVRDTAGNIIQRSGKASMAQKEWIDCLKIEGYAVNVCYGAQDAMDCIENYLK